MTNARPLATLASFLVLSSGSSGLPAAERPLLGFAEGRAAAQRSLEARFDASLDAANLRAWMKRIAARPHAVGSQYGKENADFIAAQFRSWGYETDIERFDVLFPTPKTRRLELLEPTRFVARLAEPPLAEDATSGQTREQLPVYNAYSIDGDVQGPLVYVNYGVPADYEELDRRGIDVKGKVVIARYGGSWRGIKPKVAAEHGALGCIIYSDPRDDGYFQGDVYPRGSYRNALGAQRGSVADMPLYPGDPLTPGVGATRDARRLDRKEAATLTKIPVLPISYADAQPLLKALGGPVAPEAWRGALPITYHLGPGPAKVRLRVEFDWSLAPAYDVIAKLPGRERPDEWIIRGNHHDAWVNGAEDPVSGLVALMEEARAIGELRKGGWEPKRTIVYAAWDAEEPGLLGSTEWAEAHADALRQKAAVYINSDSNGRGFLYAGGSHTLERFVGEVARDVVDPQTKLSVLERQRARRIVAGSEDDRRAAREDAEIRLDALGSGSDYTPFLQHLGIASLNIGYGGEDGGGSYHSIYDSFDHYARFGDPKFEYGVALARTAGRVTMRLADADVLPFEFTRFAQTVERYVGEVAKLADDLRAQTEEENRRIREKTYEAAMDPTSTWVTPPPRPAVPYLNLAPLQNAFTRLQTSAKANQEAAAARASRPEALAPDVQAALDRVLFGTERALTRAEGLPGRPWFRHHVYAPGFYTGYGVKTLPGVREAIEQRDWDRAAEQVAILARTLEAFAAEVDRATGLVRSAR
jgi:N-acetylated-alpha-linked acidic dipeptidase